MSPEYRCHLAAKADAKAARENKPRTTNNRQRGTMFFDGWCDGFDAVKNGDAA